MKRRSPKPPSRRCTAHLSDGSGRRCRLAPIRGGTTCHKHGSATEAAKRTARQRLNELAEPAVVALERALQKSERTGLELHPSVIRCAMAILDRTGHGPHVSLEVADNREKRAWAEHATAEERKTLTGIMAKCQARSEGRAPESGNDDASVKVLPKQEKVSQSPPPKAASEVLEL